MSVYVGIHNAGALCYLISVIQQLYFMNDFKEIIMTANSENVKAQSLIENVRVLFAAMDGQQEVDDIQCEPIFNHLYPNLADGIYTQKDASEFLSDLIRSLGLDAHLKDVLTGQLVNTLHTENDGGGSQRHLQRPEKFLFTSLTVNCPNDINNLDASLKEFTKIETIPFRWPAQPNETPAAPLTPAPTQKQTMFQTLPKHLTFHLKRFKFNVTTMKKEKLHHRFEFPNELDMQPYVLPTSTPADSSGIDTSVTHNSSIAYRFKLSGVVVHKGKSAYKGHYYSFLRERSESQATHTAATPFTATEQPIGASTDSANVDITTPVTALNTELATLTSVTADAQIIAPVEGTTTASAEAVTLGSDRWFLFDDFDVMPFDPTYLDCECFGGPRVLQRKVRRSRSSSNSSKSNSNRSYNSSTGSSARSGSKSSRQSRRSVDGNETANSHDSSDGAETATALANEDVSLNPVEIIAATSVPADSLEECAAVLDTFGGPENGDADSTASSYGSEHSRDNSSDNSSENSNDSDDSSSYYSDSTEDSGSSDSCSSSDDGESSYIPTRGKFKSAFLLFYDRIDT